MRLIRSFIFLQPKEGYCIILVSDRHILLYAEAQAMQTTDSTKNSLAATGTPDSQRLASGSRPTNERPKGQKQRGEGADSEGQQLGSAGKAGGWAGRLKSLFTIAGRGAHFQIDVPAETLRQAYRAEPVYLVSSTCLAIYLINLYSIRQSHFDAGSKVTSG